MYAVSAVFPNAVGVPNRSSQATTEKFCNPPPDSASRVKNTISPTTFGVTSPRRPAAGATALGPTGRADNAKSDIYRQCVKMLNGSENRQKIQQSSIFSEIKDNARRSVY